MYKLIAELQTAFPDLQFKAGDQFCWSPENREIMYREGTDMSNDEARWSLLPQK